MTTGTVVSLAEKHNTGRQKPFRQGDIFRNIKFGAQVECPSGDDLVDGRIHPAVQGRGLTGRSTLENHQHRDGTYNLEGK